MSFNPKNYKNQLLFIPLGGANEIGINVNLYHYQGKWIMVDCGSGFADEYLPGVNMVVADLQFIEEHKEDLLGLILTHAHEDHIGAIQYLWSSLECPIYSTQFTKNFLKVRLQEYDFADDVEIHEVTAGSKFDLGPFSIETVPLTHSAPEMQALMIRTDAGNIVHTGDWKFDPDPVIGKSSNIEALKKCGDEGVLALVCDSTNVFDKGVSGSEGDVRKSLVDIIAACPKMVVVTTFASNLARLDTLIYAGQKAGRKVALSGRSLHRMLAAAQDSGYLNNIEPLIDERSVGDYPRKDVLVIATGCQGEPMTATAKIAGKTHKSIKLLPKDTVIFSSKIIPGNEKRIFRMFNIFVKMGVEVITERDHFVHVSGHPAIEELKEMYKLVQPKICIPVHGEPVHIHEQAKLARENGIENTVEVKNGSVVAINEQDPKIINSVENGYLAVDGNYLLPSSSPIFKMRRRMQESGIVVVFLMVNGLGELVGNPSIVMPGLLDPKEDENLIKSIADSVTKSLNQKRKKFNRRLLIDQIRESARSTIRKILKHEINKSPIILVKISEIDY